MLIDREIKQMIIFILNFILKMCFYLIANNYLLFYNSFKFFIILYSQTNVNIQFYLNLIR